MWTSREAGARGVRCGGQSGGSPGGGRCGGQGRRRLAARRLHRGRPRSPRTSRRPRPARGHAEGEVTQPAHNRLERQAVHSRVGHPADRVAGVVALLDGQARGAARQHRHCVPAGRGRAGDAVRPGIELARRREDEREPLGNRSGAGRGSAHAARLAHEAPRAARASSSAAQIASAAPAGRRSREAARSAAAAGARSGGASRASSAAARARSRPTTTIRPPDSATASTHSVVPRRTRHGTPSHAASRCTPPESVRTAAAWSWRASVVR